MAMYIRVKRHKTTYFLQCDPTETILDVKQKLHSLIDHATSNQRLILLATGQRLDDNKTLAEQKDCHLPGIAELHLLSVEDESYTGSEPCHCEVENDAIVALTLRKDNNEFEAVHIEKPEDVGNSPEPDVSLG